MPTLKETAEYLETAKRIATASPGDKLRVAAACLDAGKFEMAETIAGYVVDELRALRLLANQRGKP